MEKKEVKTILENKKISLKCTFCEHEKEIDFATGFALALLISEADMEKVKNNKNYQFLVDGCQKCKKDSNSFSNVRILAEE